MIETRGVEFDKAWTLPLYLLCGHIQYDRHFDEITISAGGARLFAHFDFRPGG